MPPRKKKDDDEPITSPEDEDEPQPTPEDEGPPSLASNLSVSVQGDEIRISLPRDGREAETLDKIATLLDSLK